jgi:hypothetical protein
MEAKARGQANGSKFGRNSPTANGNVQSTHGITTIKGQTTEYEGKARQAAFMMHGIM